MTDVEVLGVRDKEDERGIIIGKWAEVEAGA